MQVLPLNAWEKFDFDSVNKVWLGLVSVGDTLPDEVVLSNIECARLANMLSKQRREDFIRGRKSLRYALLSVIGQHAKDVNIIADDKGRLFLPDFPNLRISLSHFSNVVLIGISTYDFFGVDIVKPRAVSLKVPVRIFVDSEYRLWQGLSLQKKQLQLFRTWAVKEAIVKAFGGSVWHMRQWQVCLESKCGNNFNNGESVAFAYFHVGDFLAACAWRCN